LGTVPQRGLCVSEHGASCYPRVGDRGSKGQRAPTWYVSPAT
jgi:hypothetical protein